MSCFLGHFIVKRFLEFLSQKLQLPKDRNPIPGTPTIRTPSFITGNLERLFFTIAVAADIPAFLPAMITWLGLKLVANWQLREDIENQRDKANYKVSVLLAGFLSMLISLVIGLVMRRLLM